LVVSPYTAIPLSSAASTSFGISFGISLGASNFFGGGGLSRRRIFWSGRMIGADAAAGATSCGLCGWGGGPGCEVGDGAGGGEGGGRPHPLPRERQLDRLALDDVLRHRDAHHEQADDEIDDRRCRERRIPAPAATLGSTIGTKCPEFFPIRRRHGRQLPHRSMAAS